LIFSTTRKNLKSGHTDPRRNIFGIGVLLIGALCAPQARADTTVVTFTITGPGISGSGSFMVTSTGTPGVDQITGITGTFSTSSGGGFSGPIIGLNPGSYDPNNPTVGQLADYDNLFYPSGLAPALNGHPAGGVLDDYGLDFMLAGGYTVDLFERGGTSGFLLSDGGTTRADHDVTVTVVLSAQATVTPTTLTFNHTSGSATPAQSLAVTSLSNSQVVPFTVTPSTATGGNWLVVSPLSGMTPSTLSVSLDSTVLATLSPGPYSGSVAIVSPAIGVSSINVPVTLTIGPPPLSATPSSLAFTYVLGNTVAPALETFTLTSSSAPLTYTATATSNNCGSFLSLPSASGTTPATVSVGVNPTVLPGLTSGTCSGSVTITTSGFSFTIPVTLTVLPATTPYVNAVVNAASLRRGAVAPGEILSIFGGNIGPAIPATLQLTPAGKVATTLGNTTVTFDTVPAPLIYVSGSQINLIVPYQVSGNPTTSVVFSSPAGTVPVSLTVTASSPAIFSSGQGGSGQGAILNQDESYNSVSSPAPKGSVVSIYATGEGQLMPPGGVTGSVTPGAPPFPLPAAPVTLSFLVPGPNGTTTSVPATLAYAGEAPGLVSGVLQVNAIIPSSVPSGTNTVVLTVGTNNSPSTVTVQVQ
jgi:uncharacterized protein (TIGR03437 family)